MDEELDERWRRYDLVTNSFRLLYVEYIELLYVYVIISKFCKYDEFLNINQLNQ